MSFLEQAGVKDAPSAKTKTAEKTETVAMVGSTPVAKGEVVKASDAEATIFKFDHKKSEHEIADEKTEAFFALHGITPEAVKSLNKATRAFNSAVASGLSHALDKNLKEEKDKKKRVDLFQKATAHFAGNKYSVEIHAEKEVRNVSTGEPMKSHGQIRARVSTNVKATPAVIEEIRNTTAKHFK